MADAESSAAPRLRKERTENAALRRRQIIDATFRSIVRNGLAGTTLATVSAEAGLSQGVAVFYFQNKQTLLGAALRRQYEIYQECWRKALDAAGADPVRRIAALIRADFEPPIFDTAALIIWHAFWGEANARPLYAEISDSFEAERATAMREACAALLEAEGRPRAGADDIATAVDALTDGLWLRIYLSGGPPDGGVALRLAGRALAADFPSHADALHSALAEPPEAAP